MKTYDLDEILAERGSTVQGAIEERFQELLHAFPLSELRAECGKSQSDIAKILKISQAAVSKMEARSDMLLSTIHRYVEALGGEVALGVSLGDRDYKIQPSNDRRTAFVLQQEQRVSPSVLFGAINTRSARQIVAEASAPFQGFWAQKRNSLVDVTMHDQVAQFVANDHECHELFAAAA